MVRFRACLAAFLGVTFAVAGCAAPASEDEVGEAEGASSANAPASPQSGGDGSIRTQAEADVRFRAAKCLECHAFERKLVGPSFRDVATVTARSSSPRDEKLARLVKSVRNGSQGNWQLFGLGAVPMPANVDVRESEAKALVGFILDMAPSSPSAPASSGSSR